MKYKEILRKNNIALLENEAGTEYVVAVGYDPNGPENQQWGYGNYYPYWMNTDKKAAALASALEYFRYRTEIDYISRSRMEEISTAALHELKEIDEDSFTDFCEGDLDLTEEEREWFGLDKEDGDENDS